MLTWRTIAPQKHPLRTGLDLGPDTREARRDGGSGSGERCERPRREHPSCDLRLRQLDLDGSIPVDNPVLFGVRSHVWTYGHRNGQGLTFAPTGALYEGEQGPRTDDEINILRKGGNYGWPYVAGYRDDKAYTFDNWSASAPTPCARLTYSDLRIPSSVPRQKETGWRGAFIEPVRTFGTVNNGYTFADPTCAAGRLYFMCWPTVANSSLEFYQAKQAVASPAGATPC